MKKSLEDRVERLERLNKLTQRVILALLRDPSIRVMNAAPDSITCELCNDAAWWPRNGFSEEERQGYCGPDGLDCPGFGG